jgi:methyl-accepting chemotaxis protein
VIKNKIKFLLFVSFATLLLHSGIAVPAEKEGSVEFDLKVKEMALACRDEVLQEFQTLLAAKSLTVTQLFDTFYIPIANTSPQKFSTQYDKITEPVLKTILDKYLGKDSRLLFVVAVDKNGYLPTHNSKYSMPPTSDPNYNTKFSREKRLFNDRTGLAAATNTQPFLLQKYSRDTGEELYDMSVPIFINDKHWGAIRIGYTK